MNLNPFKELLKIVALANSIRHFGINDFGKLQNQILDFFKKTAVMTIRKTNKAGY